MNPFQPNSHQLCTTEGERTLLNMNDLDLDLDLEISTFNDMPCPRNNSRTLWSTFTKLTTDMHRGREKNPIWYGRPWPWPWPWFQYLKSSTFYDEPCLSNMLQQIDWVSLNSHQICSMAAKRTLYNKNDLDLGLDLEIGNFTDKQCPPSN